MTLWSLEGIQGYLAHKKTPTPVGLHLDPRHRVTVVGSGKDIGKDKPAFGWELEPFVTVGSISGNASWGNSVQEKM